MVQNILQPVSLEQMKLGRFKFSKIGQPATVPDLSRPKLPEIVNLNPRRKINLSDE